MRTPGQYTLALCSGLRAFSLSLSSTCSCCARLPFRVCFERATLYVRRLFILWGVILISTPLVHRAGGSGQVHRSERAGRPISVRQGGLRGAVRALL